GGSWWLFRPPAQLGAISLFAPNRKTEARRALPELGQFPESGWCSLDGLSNIVVVYDNSK
ncbi:MAG: hypothetical protein ACOYLK_15010, partial [Sphingomonas sp.]